MMECESKYHEKHRYTGGMLAGFHSYYGEIHFALLSIPFHSSHSSLSYHLDKHADVLNHLHSNRLTTHHPFTVQTLHLFLLHMH